MTWQIPLNRCWAGPAGICWPEKQLPLLNDSGKTPVLLKTAALFLRMMSVFFIRLLDKKR